MERTAKIIQVLPEQRFNGKNGEVVKNAFVVEWQDNGFSQKLCLEVIGADKWEKMQKAVAVGNDVLVKYEATSREYQGRWYTSCSCFYCSNVGGQQQQVQSPVPNAQSMPQTTIPQDGSHVEDDGDLLF
jgi:hypothetical protein